MALVLSTVNMKGGVGKTTLTVNLATCLVNERGKKVLILDLDSQVSATLSLIAPQEFSRLRKGRRTLSYLIDKVIRPYIPRKYETSDLIIPSIGGVTGLDLLPGDLELYDDYVISEALYKETKGSDGAKFAEIWQHFESSLITSIIASVREQYDFIIMDCAPGYHLLTRSAIVASNFYIIPAKPEPLSLVGIQLLERRIAKLRAQGNYSVIPHLLGIVFVLSGNIFSGRYYGQVIQRIEDDFPKEQVFSTRIPMDVNVAKAIDLFTPVVLANPNTAGTKAFIKLSQEFLAKIESFSI